MYDKAAGAVNYGYNDRPVSIASVAPRTAARIYSSKPPQPELDSLGAPSARALSWCCWHLGVVIGCSVFVHPSKMLHILQLLNVSFKSL